MTKNCLYSDSLIDTFTASNYFNLDQSYEYSHSVSVNVS